MFGIDPRAVINGVMDSESIEDPNDIDHVFVTTNMRLWEESEPGRHYLYILFERLFEVHEEYGGPPSYHECVWGEEVKPEDPGTDPGEDAGTLDEPEPEPEENLCNTIYVSDDENYEQWFGYATLDRFELTMEEVNATPEASLIYYSDEKMFRPDGSLKKTYYSSSGFALTQVGYMLTSKGDARGYLENYDAPRAEPVVDDNAENRWRCRTTHEIKFDYIYEEDGSSSTDDYLLTELMYEKVEPENGNTGFLKIAIDPGDTNEISYYQIHEGGMNIMVVYDPKSLSTVFPLGAIEDEGYGVESLIGDINDLRVPLIVGLLAEMDNFDQVDIFASSLFLSIYAASYEVSNDPWWMIMVHVISVVLIFVQAYAIGETISLITEGLLAMYSGYALANIIFPLIEDLNVWIKAIASVVILVASGDASSFVNVMKMTLMELANMLKDLFKVINNFVSAYRQTVLAGYVDAIDELKASYQTALDDETDALGSTGLASSTILSTFTNIGEDVVNLNPMSAESFVGSIKNSLTLGFSDFDYNNKYDNIYNQKMYI